MICSRRRRRRRSTAVAVYSMLGLVLAGGATTARAQDDEDAPRKPLMRLLDRTGVGDDLDEAHVEFFGHAEAGWTASESNPPDDLIVGRLFDMEDQDLTFHQLVLTGERELDFARGVFDIGGRVDLMYGADARFIHANGMFDHHGFDDGPNNQFDIPQAYVDLALPYGTGIRLRLGKFVTPGGYEVIYPVGNPLYSRGLIFDYCLPFTHTGVLATYVLTENLTLDGGISRGWDQSLEDNNGMIDGIVRVSYTPNNEKYGLYVTGYLGPQQDHSNSDLRAVLDVVLTYAYADNLNLAANINYGYDEGVLVEPAGIFGSTPARYDTGQWIAAEFWAVYQYSERTSVAGRLSWLNDDDNASRGFGCDVYSATLGLSITPLPNAKYLHGLMFRPEVRFDYADEPVFDAGTDYTQGTFGVDAVVAF